MNIIEKFTGNLSNNMPTFLEGLKIMGFGMAGIFLVLLLIFGSIKVLLKLFPPKA
jgi:Na+-transporting methylmalonyl-CoA/oxaloacetate decarboxylase gamma subunit